MKRKTSKEILAESFREVAGRKNIDKITVRDITENCGYSPATFYRQFRDKYDLIAWDYTRELHSLPANGFWENGRHLRKNWQWFMNKHFRLPC